MTLPLKSSALVILRKAPGATGYKIFWGIKPKSYFNSRDIGANLSFRVPNLNRGTTYYFAAKAYNKAGISPFGNEMKHRT